MGQDRKGQERMGSEKDNDDIGKALGLAGKEGLQKGKRGVEQGLLQLYSWNPTNQL